MTLSMWVTGVIALVSTAMVVTRTAAVHALLYLIVSLLSVALIFYQLGAPLVAALEVIIYAGAIMVVFVFVLMMIDLGPRAQAEERSTLGPGVWLGPGALAAVLAAELLYALARGGRPPSEIAPVGPKPVGQALFGPYFIGVELASLLLLAGLIGALHLVKAAQRAASEPAPAGARGQA
jgi:NADH-quinone oxidoreductase subunit J